MANKATHRVDELFVAEFFVAELFEKHRRKCSLRVAQAALAIRNNVNDWLSELKEAPQHSLDNLSAMSEAWLMKATLQYVYAWRWVAAD